MLRKLRFFAEQITKADLVALPRTTREKAYELDELEVKLEEQERELLEVNANVEKLRRSHSELVELQLVLEKAGSFFDAARSDAGLHASDFSMTRSASSSASVPLLGGLEGGEAATGAAPDAATPAGLLSPSMRPWLPLRLALGEAQAVPARTTAHSSLRPTCRLCLPRLTRAGLTGWETRAHTQNRRRRPCPGARKACGSRPSWPLRRCRMRTRTTRAAARTRTPRPPPSRPVPQPDRRTPPAPPGRCSPPHCILVHTRAH